MTKSTLAVEFAAETLATGEIFAGSNVVMGVQVPIRTRMFCRMAKQGRVLAKNQKTCVETRPIVSHGTANGTKARRPPESCTGAGTRAMAGQLKAIWDRGRDAGCPAPPAQIPAGGFPAPGSSSSLAHARQAT